jgi:hypothetical protein
MSDYEARPRSMADAVVEQATANPGEKRTINVPPIITLAYGMDVDTWRTIEAALTAAALGVRAPVGPRYSAAVRPVREMIGVLDA